jgi:hypothetical protein
VMQLARGVAEWERCFISGLTRAHPQTARRASPSY